MWWIWPLTTLISWVTAVLMFWQNRYLRRTVVATTAALERADENQRRMLEHIDRLQAMQNGTRVNPGEPHE